MIYQIKNALKGFGENLHEGNSEEINQPSAAVLMLLTHEPEAQLILTKRAQHLSSHPGEIAFPGGMWEPGDDNLLDTAMRETHEEVGIPSELIQPLARLTQLRSKAGIQVTPFVGLVEPDAPIQIQASELELAFKAPLVHFLQPSQFRRYLVPGTVLYSPSIYVGEHHVWGLTAMMIQNLVNLLDAPKS